VTDAAAPPTNGARAVEVFFDPICPWAWATSRWLVVVGEQRPLPIAWRFIALRFVNEGRDYAGFPPSYGELHAAGLAMLRLSAAAREVGGNDAVGRLYGALGQRVHGDRRYAEAQARDRGLFAEAVAAAGLPAALAGAADDDVHDDLLREETELALTRAGRDLGTPVVTFDPGTADEGSFFGPVIDHVPTGDAAVALFDTVVALARAPGFLELKRARPGPAPRLWE
jgi:hypothetical protein